ncbi:hypothetical protein HDU76_005511 [Blyttiomyces sp. JEL0837]|nr:hypothetical protein HDU76_005511 [Blyttiomyces sp. JEL0837]
MVVKNSTPSTTSSDLNNNNMFDGLEHTTTVFAEEKGNTSKVLEAEARKLCMEWKQLEFRNPDGLKDKLSFLRVVVAHGKDQRQSEKTIHNLVKEMVTDKSDKVERFTNNQPFDSQGVVYRLNDGQVTIEEWDIQKFNGNPSFLLDTLFPPEQRFRYSCGSMVPACQKVFYREDLSQLHQGCHGTTGQYSKNVAGFQSYANVAKNNVTVTNVTVNKTVVNNYYFGNTGSTMSARQFDSSPNGASTSSFSKDSSSTTEVEKKVVAVGSICGDVEHVRNMWPSSEVRLGEEELKVSVGYKCGYCNIECPSRTSIQTHDEWHVEHRSAFSNFVSNMESNQYSATTSRDKKRSRGSKRNDQGLDLDQTSTSTSTEHSSCKNCRIPGHGYKSCPSKICGNCLGPSSKSHQAHNCEENCGYCGSDKHKACNCLKVCWKCKLKRHRPEICPNPSARVESDGNWRKTSTVTIKNSKAALKENNTTRKTSDKGKSSAVTTNNSKALLKPINTTTSNATNKGKTSTVTPTTSRALLNTITSNPTNAGKTSTVTTTTTTIKSSLKPMVTTSDNTTNSQNTNENLPVDNNIARPSTLNLPTKRSVQLERPLESTANANTNTNAANYHAGPSSTVGTAGSISSIDDDYVYSRSSPYRQTTTTTRTSPPSVDNCNESVTSSDSKNDTARSGSSLFGGFNSYDLDLSDPTKKLYHSSLRVVERDDGPEYIVQGEGWSDTDGTLVYTSQSTGNIYDTSGNAPFPCYNCPGQYHWRYKCPKRLRWGR